MSAVERLVRFWSGLCAVTVPDKPSRDGRRAEATCRHVTEYTATLYYTILYYIYYTRTCIAKYSKSIAKVYMMYSRLSLIWMGP